MKIQNNNTNAQVFGAKRILTTQRYYKVAKVPTTEIIDVFKLDRIKDLNFIKRCYQLLENRFTRTLDPAQKQMKVFFKDILEDANGTKEYYMSVKNNEQIAGGISAVPFDDKLFLTQAFSIYPKDYYLDNLFYGFLSDSQEEYKSYRVILNNLIDNLKYKKNEVAPQEISTMRRKINKSHINTQFFLKKDKDIDMEEFLGIKDFESELNPNLK